MKYKVIILLIIFIALALFSGTFVKDDSLYIFFTHDTDFVKVDIRYNDPDPRLNPDRYNELYEMYDKDTKEFKGVFITPLPGGEPRALKSLDYSVKSPPRIGIMSCYNMTHDKVYSLIYFNTGIYDYSYDDYAEIILGPTVDRLGVYFRDHTKGIAVKRCDDNFLAVYLMIINYYDLKTKKFVYPANPRSKIVRYVYDPATSKYTLYEDEECKKQSDMTIKEFLIINYDVNPFVTFLFFMMKNYSKLKIVTDLYEYNQTMVLYTIFVRDIAFSNTLIKDKNISASLREIMRLYFESFRD